MRPITTLVAAATAALLIVTPTAASAAHRSADPLRIHKLGDRAAIERTVQRLMTEVGLNPERADHSHPVSLSPTGREKQGWVWWDRMRPWICS